jgi:hypothetical protein
MQEFLEWIWDDRQQNQNHPFFQPSKSTKLLFIQYRKKP